MKVLITGANRGIGLGLTERFAHFGHEVVACCRNPDGARELWEVESESRGRVKIKQLDITQQADVDKLAADMRGETIDILLNNAGMLPDFDSSIKELSIDALERSFEVNTIGPIRVVKGFLANLEKSSSPIIANISSKVGSIADNSSGRGYAYRSSKTALNMLNTCLDIELQKICCVVIHPGWVKTDMGGQAAPTDILESSESLTHLITRLDLKDSGRFLDYQGNDIPW